MRNLFSRHNKANKENSHRLRLLNNNIRIATAEAIIKEQKDHAKQVSVFEGNYRKDGPSWVSVYLSKKREKLMTMFGTNHWKLLDLLKPDVL